MIDFFASLTVGLIIFMTIVILYSNQRQARALNEMKHILDGWVQSQMRDRRESRFAKTHIENPIQWFGDQAGLKLLDVQRKIEEPPVIEFLAEEGKRLVVSPLSPGYLRKGLKSLEAHKKNLKKLVDPLLGKEWRKVEVLEKSPSSSGEWFDVEAQVAVKALQVNWKACERLWFYIIRPRETKREPFISIDLDKQKIWLIDQKEKIHSWLKTQFSKLPS